MLLSLATDLRFVARSLRRNAVFAVAVGATLALGIGALSAVFSTMYAILLRPLPYREADRLVTLWVDLRANGRAEPEWLSFPDFADWRDQSHTLAAVAAYTGWNVTVPGDGTIEPERIPGASVSWNYFDVLGASPALGRSFTADQDVPNAERVVVLGDGVWRRRFGADPSIVGRALTLNDEPWTVIGVMPPSFRPPMPGPQLWRPLRQTRASDPCGRGCVSLQTIARLAPNATIADARSDLSTILRHAAETDPDVVPNSRAWPIPLRDQLVGDVRTPLLVLVGAVALVLMLVCANLANLLFARGLRRTGEIAVRMALGADRARIRRELLLEAVVLAGLGGLVGLAVAAAGIGVLRSIMPPRIAAVATIALDWRALSFTALASVGTGLLFGATPAWRLADLDVGTVLRDTSRGGGRRDVRYRNALVVAQFALALVLLNAAALLTRSFLTLDRTALGFDPTRLVAVELQLPRNRYPTPTEADRFFETLTDRLRTLPSVTNAGATSVAPLDNGDVNFGFTKPGETPRRGSPPSLWTRRVTAGYLETMGMTLIAGRSIATTDQAGAPPVAVINEAAVRTYWAGESPLNKTIMLQGPGGDNATEIVGIVASARHDGAQQPEKPEVFVPAAQTPARGMTVVVRTHGAPETLIGPVRAAIREMEPSLAVPAPALFADRVAESIALPRIFMRVLAAFGIAALALASIGIYGLVRYSVETRAREFGIRLAVGAAPGRILTLVAREIGLLASLGVAAGLIGVRAAGTLFAAMLVGVTANDIPTILGTTATLLFTGTVAMLIPARRAMRTDPSIALRQT